MYPVALLRTQLQWVSVRGWVSESVGQWEWMGEWVSD